MVPNVCINSEMFHLCAVVVVLVSPLFREAVVVKYQVKSDYFRSQLG